VYFAWYYTKIWSTFPNWLVPEPTMSIYNTTQPIASAHVPIHALSGDNKGETHRFSGRRIIHCTFLIGAKDVRWSMGIMRSCI
jgi:hypothetical protein